MLVTEKNIQRIEGGLTRTRRANYSENLLVVKISNFELKTILFVNAGKQISQ